MDDDIKETFLQKALEYDFIRFTVADMHGISKGKVVPARNTASYAKKGPQWWTATIAMGPTSETPMSLKKCVEGHQGNAYMAPMLDTLHEVPWAGKGKYKVGAVISESNWMDGTPQEACTRYVARKQLEKLKELGYTLLSGFEYEFMLYEKGTRNPAHSGHHFCTTSVTGQHESFLFDLDTSLSKIGVNIRTLQTEYAEGQIEVTCQPKFGIETADETFMFREAVKEISCQNGFDYNFMSKPEADVGNGAHFNISLWDLKGERNVFHNPDDPDKLSDVCKYFMGGLIKHATTVTALCSPTVNCYRRIHTPWAADIANWGIEDRLSSFRVKNYNPKVTLIENRICGGACNPYLATAVTLAAGIDGIRNKIKPPPMYQQDAPRLPDTLEDAMKELEKDKVMVEALGSEFVEWFTQTKRDFELKALEGFDPKVYNKEWQDKEWKEYSKI